MKKHEQVRAGSWKVKQLVNQVAGSPAKDRQNTDSVEQWGQGKNSYLVAAVSVYLSPWRKRFLSGPRLQAGSDDNREQQVA